MTRIPEHLMAIPMILIMLAWGFTFTTETPSPVSVILDVGILMMLVRLEIWNRTTVNTEEGTQA